jgi:hypothetical protein
MVASGTFEVGSDKGKAAPPTKKTRKKIDMPDDLGEL